MNTWTPIAVGKPSLPWGKVTTGRVLSLTPVTGEGLSRRAVQVHFIPGEIVLAGICELDTLPNSKNAEDEGEYLLMQILPCTTESSGTPSLTSGYLRS